MPKSSIVSTRCACVHVILALLAIGGAPGCQAVGSVSGPDATATSAAAIVLANAAGLTTNESGTNATFDVTLAAAPNATVTIVVASQDVSEVAVSPASATLTFTSANWSAAQRVTLIGQDDALIDGPIALAVTLDASASADASYQALAPLSVAVTNVDNDTAALSVTPSSLDTTEGGSPVIFTVQPTTPPAAATSIIVSVTSGDSSEGVVSPAQLTFDAANWATAQSVTVTPVDDTDQDGTQTYTITLDPATSTEPSYAALAAQSDTIDNADNDVAGLTLTPSALETMEGGPAVTFTVRPTSAPSAGASVILDVTSLDTSEGTLSPSQLTFTAANWTSPQTVTVAPVDDAAQDGDQTYTIEIDPAASTAAAYASLAVQTVTVQNDDNDTPGLAIKPLMLTTHEGGAVVTFTVRARSVLSAGQPVNVDVTSLNTAEGTLSPSTLSFDDTNWSVPQTVTITPLDDGYTDGDQVYDVTLDPAGSADASYASLGTLTVQVTNTDSEPAGLILTPTTLITTEGGVSQSFTVQPAAQPAPGTTISLALDSTNTSEGTLSTYSLSFDDGNWTSPQTVFVYPQSDGVVDGDVVYAITLDPAASTTPGYATLGVRSVSITNRDVDAPIVVTDITGLVPYAGSVTAGGRARFLFDVAAFTRYVVTLSGLAANADLGLYMDSSFTSSLGGSAHLGTTDEQRTLFIPNNRLYLEVDATAAAADTSFTLDVQPFVPPAPVDLDGMLPRTATIDVGVAEYFVTSVTPGSLYSVSLSGTDGPVRLQVYDDDSQFAFSWCGRVGNASCTLQTSGSLLYLTVDGESLGATATYTLDVQPYVPPTPQDLDGTSLPYTDTLAQGSTRYFVKTVTLGATYTVSATDLGMAGQLEVFYDNTFLGNVCVEMSFGAGSVQCVVKANDTLLYLALDGTDLSADSPFTLDVQLYVPPTPTDITSSLPNYADSVASGAANYYAATVTPGVYTVSLSGLTDFAELAVYDDSSFVFARCTYLSPSSARCTVPVSGGTVYVGVSGKGPGTADFVLDVAAVSITHLSSGVLPYDDAAAPLRDNYYDLPVTPGNSYEITITHLTNDLDLSVFSDPLYSSWECGSYNGGTTDELCTVTASGPVLYVQVGSNYGGTTVTYTVGVTNLGP